MSDEPQPILGLEAKLRELAARGELTHFSLVPNAGKGPNGIVWSASYTPASKWGTGFGNHADPIEAAMMAFKDVRLPKMVEHFASNGDKDAKVIADALAKGELPPPDAEAKFERRVKGRAKKVVGEEDFV